MVGRGLFFQPVPFGDELAYLTVQLVNVLLLVSNSHYEAEGLK
jgi:hypothetical protein